MNPHVDDLISHPSRHFHHPDEVLNEPTLSLAEKRRVLESWKQDAQRLAESTAENMSGGEESDLRDVSKVLIQLSELEKAPVATQTGAAPASMDTKGVGTGMAVGAIVGAGAGLLLTTVTGPSIALVAQAAIVGLILGGVAVAVRNAIRS